MNTRVYWGHTRTFFMFAFLIYICASQCHEQIHCFQKSLFKFDFPPAGFYQLNTITQNTNNHQGFDKFNILAYGDFNNDLNTDFIAKNDQTNATNDIQLYLWKPDRSSYIKERVISNSECFPSNVYLYDVNSDGLLDITIFGELQDTNDENNCLVPFLQSEKLRFNKGKSLQFSTSSQPTLFSYGSKDDVKSRKIAFFYFSITQQERKVALYATEYYHEYITSNWNEIFISSKPFDQISFRSPHWNSFFDFTGDCLSDVVAIDEEGNIEFWVNKHDKFEYLRSEQHENMVSLSFADMNYDGTPDMIIAFQNSIKIAYNEKSLNGESEFCCNECTDIKLKLPETKIIYSQGSEIKIQQQILHIEDIDINGYPDILFYYTKQADNKTSDYPIIYLNQEGETFSVGKNYAFEIMENQQEILLNGDIVSVSFLDIYENGILDVLVVIEASSGQYNLYSFYNNYLYQNSFFIKGYGAFGVNSSSGCQINGASFYWVNSIGDTIRSAYQSQIIQTAYSALQIPYAYSGLGRANNYVETFTLGIYGQKRSWSPIIPNSQLAVYATSTSPTEWGIRIFVLPTDSLTYVIIVSVVILIIMGAALLVIKYKNHKKKQQPLMMDFIN